MAEVKKLGSVKRFGPRYGRKVKVRLAKIEAVQRGKHQCPYCHAWKVKRLATGIWHCNKCEAKFTGKAYSIKKIAVVEEEKIVKKKRSKKKEDAEEELAEDAEEEDQEEAKEEA